MLVEVTVERMEFRQHTFEVEADTIVEAKTLAHEEAANYNYWHDRVIDIRTIVTSINKLTD